MKEKLVKLTWIVIAIVWIAVGCSPSSIPSIPTQPPTRVPPTQPPPPMDTPAPMDTSAQEFPNGVFTKANWTLEFKADGSLHVEQQFVKQDGVYTVSGDQMTTQGGLSCEDIVGTYTWTYNDQVLVFKPVKDKCTDRLNVIWGNWRKKP